MLKEKYLIRAFWGPRRVEREETVSRIQSLIAAIREIDATYEDLHAVGQSLAEPVGKIIGSTSEQIDSLLTVDSQFVHLGFQFSAMLPDGAINAYIMEGSYSKYVSNMLMMEFYPVVSDSVLDSLTTARISLVLKAIAEIFDPFWGQITTWNHLENIHHIGGEPYASWMLYLKRPHDELPPLPESVVVQRISDIGVLFVLTQDRFCSDTPDHVDLAADVTARLEAAGLLHVPWEMDDNQINSD